MKGALELLQSILPPPRSRKAIIPLAALLVLAAWSATADQYHGNGSTSYDGAIGKGTLTLSYDGTNISGTLTVGGAMNDALVLYIQSGPGGFADTSGFSDQSGSCCRAISGFSAAGRSLLTFAGGFRPNYAIALAPGAAGMGTLWRLANGGNYSLVYLAEANLAPINHTGPYTFSFGAALIGMTPGVRSTIQVFGTYVSIGGTRSTEAIAGDLIGIPGWNPFTQTAYANCSFEGDVPVDLPFGFWVERPGSSPVGRYYHTAVWTGSEMIVWGGYGNNGCLNDGARYNPTANVWTALPTIGAPAARYGHTAIWTGSEMIVWGGHDTSTLNSGGRFNPVANSWTALPATGAPGGRETHTAVWSGSEMIVWGGYRGWSFLNDGGRYNPVHNSWTALSTTGTPAARDRHTAVWTGSEMIVWGGSNFNADQRDGGRYSPAANSWTPLPTTGTPGEREYHTAVWTGSDMIVWGGGSFNPYGSIHLNDGGRYNPAANTWTALPVAGTPAARDAHTAVWTGSDMIIFGGIGSSGCRSDTWSYYPYAPKVLISPSGPSSAVVAWPMWYPTLRLCQTTNLALGQWTTVTNAVIQGGSENHVTLSPLSSGQFFRAVYP
jgi:N-acetylneuraminic acid mutarotase